MLMHITGGMGGTFTRKWLFETCDQGTPRNALKGQDHKSGRRIREKLSHYMAKRISYLAYGNNIDVKISRTYRRNYRILLYLPVADRAGAAVTNLKDIAWQYSSLLTNVSTSWRGLVIWTLACACDT